MTKVHVDMNLCQSHGECAYVAPEIFELGDDDVLQWKEEVDPALREKAEEAADACPMQAIRVQD
jgi:ferredoxin